MESQTAQSSLLCETEIYLKVCQSALLRSLIFTIDTIKL